MVGEMNEENIGALGGDKVANLTSNMSANGLISVGEKALAGIAKTLPNEEMRTLGSEKLDAVITGVEIQTITEMTADKLGEMMDVIEADQISRMDEARKSEVLKSVGATLLLSTDGEVLTDWQAPEDIESLPALAQESASLEEQMLASWTIDDNPFRPTAFNLLKIGWGGN
jgi:hypothetical protein